VLVVVVDEAEADAVSEEEQDPSHAAFWLS
jgi:hypothetical protein